MKSFGLLMSFATACTVAAALSACGSLDPIGNDTDGMEEGVPQAVVEAFAMRCSCHDTDSSPAGNLSLTAAALGNLEGASSNQSNLPLVTRGNISQSYLALKMLDDTTLQELIDSGDLEGGFSRGERMPLGGPFGDVNDAIILGWIAGAELPGGGTGNESDSDGSDSDSTSDTDGPDCSSVPSYGDIDWGACTHCHDSSLSGDARQFAPASVNFDTYDDAVMSADRAMARVDAGTMPPANSDGPELTQDVADQIILWASCGTPE